MKSIVESRRDPRRARRIEPAPTALARPWAPGGNQVRDGSRPTGRSGFV